MHISSVCNNSPLNHKHVFFTASCGGKLYFLFVLSPFYVAYMQPLSCRRDIFVAYEKRISWIPQGHTYIGQCINVSIYGGVEHFIFTLMYLQFYLCIDLWSYGSQMMRRRSCAVLVPLYMYRKTHKQTHIVCVCVCACLCVCFVCFLSINHVTDPSPVMYFSLKYIYLNSIYFAPGWPTTQNRTIHAVGQ